ncbi:MAG TPA: cytochrome c-type biogenesis protein [Gammaproteobacteria bacterium]|nr:cytochrome c-type biogenesis protein [Gammaproteobacteria bacterium]
MKIISLILTLLLIAANAWAIDTNHLPTPALQARYETLTHQFRCLVCQDEDIYTSNADLAVQLRDKVRDMLVAGKTNQQIIDYMVDRYGNFVLYKPPVEGNTLLLWFGPFALLLVALGVVVWVVRRRSAMATDEPTERATP